MAERLSKLQGKFLLSLNDVPEIRTIFKAFQIREVQTAYSVAIGRCTPERELLIKNF